MGFKEIASKIGNALVKQPQMREDIPDDQTTDKYLRSLRRQRRLQMEELEKERLKKNIAAFQKNKVRQGLFGIKEPSRKKPSALLGKSIFPKKKRQTFYTKTKM